MTNKQNDPLGYYQKLGVNSNSTTDEIKKAYRQKAMELHPDRNQNRDTTADFQSIQSAYDVLSDPIKRAHYDTQAIKEDYSSVKTSDYKPFEPIKCSMCGCISAQPRYVIFYKVLSLIILTQKSATQGIYCAACAAKVAFKNSLKTWLMGWWGFPWGFIYSIQVIFKNLIGGDQPPEMNAQIMGYQAFYFAQNKKYDLARSIAKETLNLALKAKRKKHLQVKLMKR